MKEVRIGEATRLGGFGSGAKDFWFECEPGFPIECETGFTPMEYELGATCDPIEFLPNDEYKFRFEEPYPY